MEGSFANFRHKLPHSIEVGVAGFRRFSSPNVIYWERLVRLMIALICFAGATHGQSWLLFPAAVFLLSGYTGHCPMYKLAGINEQKSIVEYYRSVLPDYNPQPVLVFNAAGKKIYANEPGEALMPGKAKLNDFCFNSNSGVWFDSEPEWSKMRRFETQGKIYSLNIRKINSIECYVIFGSEITDLVAADQEIIQTQKDIVYAMGAIGESRSQETGNHVIRVAEYSRLLAELAGLPDEEAELLRMASPMHDIGKVAIPDAILNKPGKLTEDEFHTMKTHAALGYEMLRYSDRPILKAAATVAHEHHERWDGSGYPRQISGENIHIYGRITALADVFDALGSDRVYKKAWPLNKILALVVEERGKHFEPKLVDLFLENLQLFLEIRDRYQDPLPEKYAEAS